MLRRRGRRSSRAAAAFLCSAADPRLVRRARAAVQGAMTTMTDEQKRIRGYLEAQGAKLAPPAIVEKVREAMGRLRARPPWPCRLRRFAQAPAPGEWSANEVMAHVVDAGRHFGEGILHALDGLPPASGAMPRSDRRRRATPPRSGSRCSTGTASSCSIARCAPTRRAGSSSRSHTASSACSTGARRCLFIRVHDLDHAGQLEKIAAALGSRRLMQRRHLAAPGQRRLGEGERLGERGRAARRRLRVVGRGVGPRRRDAAGVPRRADDARSSSARGSCRPARARRR